jgi:hypothetical protein
VIERPEALAVPSVVISLTLLALLAVFLRYPPLKDVTTTPDAPPQFALDPPGAVEYPDRFAGLQDRAYPDLAALVSPEPVPVTFRRAAEAAREMGWEVVFEDESLAVLQAVARTRFFGFKDDVVVDVRPRDAGSEIHIRSRSRVGRTDLGTNARRIRAYLEELR